MENGLTLEDYRVLLATLENAPTQNLATAERLIELHGKIKKIVDGQIINQTQKDGTTKNKETK